MTQRYVSEFVFQTNSQARFDVKLIRTLFGIHIYQVKKCGTGEMVGHIYTRRLTETTMFDLLRAFSQKQTATVIYSV